MSKIRLSSDAPIIGCLIMLAVFIWLRDTTWISSSDDTLPILVAIPLFIWIGSPWHFKDNPETPSLGWIALTAFLFLVGIAINSTLLLTLSWCALLWAWLSKKVTNESLPTLKKLMILPLMAFPWISLDADRIGWWFRLSGAWTTAQFFSLLGLDVKQEGTLLNVNGLPISVEVACAGLNTLQSMLIAGSVVAFLILGDTKRYWVNLPLLVVMAWVANTLRIILISAAALLITPAFSKGNFHVFGGWVVIMLMFCLCWFIFSLQEPKEPQNR